MAIMKDLPVSKDVKAGALISNDNLTLVRAAKPAKDLPASKDIKAGRKGFQLNDNVTLIRAAKPAKDLTTGKDVKGGRKKQFRSLEDTMALKKDLPAKKNVKGGRLAGNDTLTFVRAAKPVKDLPASKTVKAGQKVRQDESTEHYWRITMANENITLIRAAKPAKDLPAGKDVKGGRKAGKKAAQDSSPRTHKTGEHHGNQERSAGAQGHQGWKKREGVQVGSLQVQQRLEDTMATKKRDLPPSKNPKGGRINLQSVTLLVVVVPGSSGHRGG